MLCNAWLRFLVEQVGESFGVGWHGAESLNLAALFRVRACTASTTEMGTYMPPVYQKSNTSISDSPNQSEPLLANVTESYDIVVVAASQ